MSTVSKISQFVLGFILAIALLFLAGAGLTRYLLSRIATLPPRPSFTNDPSPVANASPAANPAASPAPVAASPVPSPSPSPSPSPQGYAARVVQPIGLRIRQSPSADAETVGGVEYNREVVVLEDSPDGAWQKVRVGSTEGWVKGGNTERIN
ncbi:MAG: SH3 domain-containing protein [Elainella sp.]